MYGHQKNKPSHSLPIVASWSAIMLCAMPQGPMKVGGGDLSTCISHDTNLQFQTSQAAAWSQGYRIGFIAFLKVEKLKTSLSKGGRFRTSGSTFRSRKTQGRFASGRTEHLQHFSFMNMQNLSMSLDIAIIEIDLKMQFTKPLLL